VRSLTLLDAAHPRYTDERRRGLARNRLLVKLYLRLIALRPGAVEKRLKRSFFDDETVTPELVWEYRRRLAVEGAVDAFRGLTVPLSEPEPAVPLSEISVPTLALWGAEDPFIPVEPARKVVAEIPGSRFVEVAHAGHGPLEDQPEAVAREILNFLEDLDSSPPQGESDEP
jgi:pimeloyl-ACP methyl ester carboxylesterase